MKKATLIGSTPSTESSKINENINFKDTLNPPIQSFSSASSDVSGAVGVGLISGMVEGPTHVFSAPFLAHGSSLIQAMPLSKNQEESDAKKSHGTDF
jgi:hypothetical protein